MERMSHLLHPLQRYQLQIEHALGEAVLQLGEESPLRAACEYSLLVGGKRLRPAVVLMVADALGARHSVIKAALATEFLHTASLIADDLPSMDNAELRRDALTLHRKYGEDVALLATYALIAAGYGYIAENALELKQLEPAGEWDHVCVLAIANATRNTGIHGTTGGQYLDLHPPAVLEDALARLIHLKTTTLFEVSFVLGWLFGGGNRDQLPSVAELSRNFGLAYQIADDLDDLEEDRQLGRGVNYALQFGETQARVQLSAALDACEQLAHTLGLRGAALFEITSALRQTAALA